MKKLLPLLALSFLLTGCVSATYVRSGEEVKFTVRSVLMSRRIISTELDRQTKETRTGLKLGQVDSTGDAATITALTEAIVAGAVKGAK